jgi:large subunit ribosomal protein L25
MKRLSPLEDGRAVFFRTEPGHRTNPRIRSMASAELKAKARSGVGKGAARALRREGWIPAVIYGDKKEPTPISISYNEAMKSIYAGGFLSHVITLDVDGTKHRVIPRDYQLDPVKDKAMHVDFLRVGAHTKLNVQVAVHFINQEQSPGIKKGGVLNIVHHTLELSVPADAIPDSLTVDLTGRDIGDTIHLSAITLPAGTSVRTHETDLTIATIAAPSAMRSDDAAAAPAEAAAAAPAAGATGAAPAAGAKAPAAPGKK